VETAFVSQRKDTLLRRTKAFLGIPLVVITVLLCVQCAQGRYSASGGPTETARLCLAITLWSSVAIAVALAVALAVLHCNCLMKHIKAAELEGLVTFVLCFFLTSIVMSRTPYVTKLAGHSLTEAFGDEYFSDSVELLLIDGCIAVTHLGLPVRWWRLFHMEAVGVLLFATIIFTIGGNEPMNNSIWNLIVLMCLVICASVGKRSAEITERHTFKDIIREKSLRCSAEFQLEQATSEQFQARDRQRALEQAASEMFQTRDRQRALDLLPEVDLEESRGSGARSRSNIESVAPTSQSGSIYEQLYDNGPHMDRTGPLARIAAQGDAEHWRLNEGEVSIFEADVLGAGSFGVVIRAMFCGIMVAVKRPHNPLGSANPETLVELCNELRILRRLRHPNIVATYGAAVDPDTQQISLVLELVEGVGLAEFMKGETDAGPSLLARYQVMVGMCRALLYMHTRVPHIVHGDLKANNIMLQICGDDVHPKLLDFGLARVLTRRVQPLGGTLSWMAPEVEQMSGPVKCSADVYSFGHLLAFLATGLNPASDMSSRTIRWSLANARPPLPTWPQGCPLEPTCRPLAHACLRINETERLTIVEVYQRLVRVPQMIHLSDSETPFLRDVSTIAARFSEQVWSFASRGLEQEEFSLRSEQGRAAGPPSVVPEVSSCSIREEDYDEGEAMMMSL